MKAEIIYLKNKSLEKLENNLSNIFSSALSKIDINNCSVTVVDSSFEQVISALTSSFAAGDVIFVCQDTAVSDEYVSKIVFEAFNTYSKSNNNCFSKVSFDECAIIESGSKTVVLMLTSDDKFEYLLTKHILPYLSKGINDVNLFDAANCDEITKETATKAVTLLRQNNLKISTAESCTSGMLSSLITSVPHSSEIFELGISAYSTRIKEEALSVPTETLRKYGAISSQTAMYLAKNVRSLSDANVGVGITGNAGPSADEGKPVGLIYVAIADKNGYFVKELNLSPLNSREKNREIASLVALDLIKLYASSYPTTPSFFAPFNSEKKSTPVLSDLKSSVSPTQYNTFLPLEDDEINSIQNLDNEATYMDLVCEEPTVLEEETPSDINIPSDNISPNSDETSVEPNIESNADAEIVPSEKSDKIKKIFTAFAKKATALAKKLTTLAGKLKFNKSDGIKDNITKLIFIISLVAFLISAVVLGFHFVSDNTQQSLIEDAQDKYNEIVVTPADSSKLFESLKNDNPDIKAWITIENTTIDHPICQTSDNDFYLKHNMYKVRSRYGALFFDYKNTVGGDNQSKNLTIYGHNMNNGSMFAELENYKNLDFYLNNPTFKITTPEGIDTYAIFSVMIMNATSKDDNDYLYGFTRSSFHSNEHFMSWISESLERSLINTNVVINENDQIMTLVTCEDANISFDNARLVVMAKKVSDDELQNMTFEAQLNPNPRYPQAWYDAKGLDGYTPSSNATSSANNSSSEILESTDSSLEDISSDVSSDTDSSASSEVASSLVETTSSESAVSN